MNYPAPYPADTRAKGWRFELDLEQISQSDTWALAPQDVRPWLLMLWSVSWQQTPCGSLPGEDAIIAARIGMKPAAFAKHKAVLLRGWEIADDGRLYHPTITQRVLSMLDVKQKEKDRKAAYRARMSGNVPRDNQWTDPGCDATGTGTGTGLKPNQVDKHTQYPPTEGVCVSPVGDCCRALVDAGIPATKINQGHPKLLALVEAGATVIEFGETARECVGKGNPDFAYVLGTMTRRREQAAATNLHQGAMPRKTTPGQRSADAAQRWLDSQETPLEAHG